MSLVSRLFAAALLGVAVTSCGDCNKSTVIGSTTPEPAKEAGGGLLDAEAKREAGIINQTPVPTASVAKMVNPDALAPYAGPTGSVEGTVSVTGDPAPLVPQQDFSRCPDAANTWGHSFREGPPVAGARPLADAIVVVTGYHGFFVPEKEEIKELRIEGCGYTTLTATMTFGQRLDIRNVSRDFWTPMLEPGPNLVMMMATPNGDPVRIYPKKPGHHLLVDRDRKYAIVDVYVFLHPLHASTNVLGHYRIDGVPVGKLKVSSTHPHVDANAETEVVVQEGVVHRVDLVLKNVRKDAAAPDSGAAAGASAPPLLH